MSEFKVNLITKWLLIPFFSFFIHRLSEETQIYTWTEKTTRTQLFEGNKNESFPIKHSKKIPVNLNITTHLCLT